MPLLGRITFISVKLSRRGALFKMRGSLLRCPFYSSSLLLKEKVFSLSTITECNGKWTFCFKTVSNKFKSDPDVYSLGYFTNFFKWYAHFNRIVAVMNYFRALSLRRLLSCEENILRRVVLNFSDAN